MSGLPSTIHVKRKRAENGVVDFICFEYYATKRHKGYDSGADGGYIYQRRKVEDVESAESLASGPAAVQSQPRTVPVSELSKYELPTIRASNSGDENRPIKPIRKKKASEHITDIPCVSNPTLPVPALLSDDLRNARRFHLSKSSPLSSASGVTGARVSKKRSAAVFVERGGSKRVRPVGQSKPDGKQDVLKEQVQLLEASEKSSDVTFQLPIREGTPKSPVKLRRPNARVRIQPSSQPVLPPSFHYHGADVDMDQLARDMDAYSLEVVKQNLARVEQEKQKEQARALRAKFRPRGQPPGQRFFERNPEYVAQWERDHSNWIPNGDAEGDAEGDESDDDDYIMETYERVPASMLSNAVQPHQIGLLVFDNEEDKLEFFYGTEGDSDDEFLEDEDDENAEGHYTADYPDEELEWDDELDQNAYSYVTQNASDLEEFDEEAFMEQAHAWDEDGQHAAKRIFPGLGASYTKDQDMQMS